MKKLILFISTIFIISCSSDNNSPNENENVIDFYEITLRLHGTPNAGYNTQLRINTFYENSAQLHTVFETQNEITWNNGTIEHTFTIEAKSPLDIPLTNINCYAKSDLHQDYDYTIDSFYLSVILKDDNGNIISELSTSEDTIDGWLSFTGEINIEL